MTATGSDALELSANDASIFAITIRSGGADLGALGLRNGIDRALLGVTGPAGDALRLYPGERLEQATGTEETPGLEEEPDLWRFELANPTAPGFVPSPLPGVDLANDFTPNLRDAFVLEGAQEEERLAGSVSMADFNGDSFNDLLVYGDKASYVLLGPVELDSVESIAQAADIVIAADVGRPASRMGDLTGDGLDDLVFLKQTVGDDFELIIIAGGNGAGIELPRVIDYAWVDATNDVLNQERVRIRSATGLPEGFADPSASLAVLNWNDDGHADVALVRSSAPSFNVQGYMLSGDALWNEVFDALDPDGTTGLGIIVSDTTDREMAAREILGVAEGEPLAAFTELSTHVRAVAAGDITGDGLDDLLLADSGYVDFTGTEGFSNIGKAYVLTGRVGAPTLLWLDAPQEAIDFLGGVKSELVVQDFSLGGSVSALGDLNFDGYDDFAVGSLAEGQKAFPGDTVQDAGLLVYFGQAGFDAEPLSARDADIRIVRAAGDDVLPGSLFHGALHATGGDFDGDGHADLAVGETARLVTTGQQIIDQDDSGALYVFSRVADGSTVKVLTEADARVRGEFEFDGFGALPATPAFDLDLDGLDDLLVGAATANVTTTEVIPEGGKIYVIYGSSSRAALPADAIELGNRSFTGAGFFLVGKNLGEVEVFQDAPGEDEPKFILDNGNERWYTFQTLGDGMPGNVIRILSGLGAIDGFVDPIAPTTSTLEAGTPSTDGNRLIQRNTVDGAVGSMFVAGAFQESGRLTQWSVFSGNFVDGVGAGDDRYLTPLIFKQTAGGFQITGIGKAERIAPNSTLTFDFELESGSDSVGPGYRLGWYDGSAAGENAGAVGFNTFAFSGDEFGAVGWFGPNQGAAQNLELNRTLNPIQTFTRYYAINASVTSGAVLEFDLGRFLGWAGNPDAVGSAQLVLHAPQTTAPIQAPVNIGAILPVGNLVFFSASTPGEGQELWVTEGTEETTRFVADLNPGADGSFPGNFVNVGGKLYFTANTGVAGTQLWKSDGTTDGTQKVADIPGFAANLTALSGSAVLTAATAGPSDGIPAVDYAFTLEILRANGTLESEAVTLPRAATAENGSFSMLLLDVQNAVAAALPGEVSVSTPDGERFVFSALDEDIVRIRVLGGEALGFGANQASEQQVSLTGAPVTAPNVGAVSFTLDVEVIGGDVISVEVPRTAEVTADNTTAEHLAADLNAILPAALLSNGFGSGAVTVSADSSGALVLTVGDANIASITVRAGTGTAAGLASLGLTEGQTSTRTVALTATLAGPTDGQVPADLTLTVTVVLSTGETEELAITLEGGDTALNGSLDDLAGQLEEAINLELGLGEGVVSVDASPSFILTIVSSDASITSIAIDGGELLGFTAGQTSARSGDRLYFRAAAASQGAELWVLNVDETDAAPDVPASFDVLSGPNGSNPFDLTKVGNTLYFAAFNGTTNALYRVDLGVRVESGTPVQVPGPFTNVAGLINANGTLAFVALPNGLSDRQVFTYSGTAFTQLTNVTPTDVTDFSPSELTYFNNRIYFAARDHADGEFTSPAGPLFVGRELWSVPLAGGPTTVAANIGGPDEAAQTIFFTFPPFPPIPIGTDPGNVVSSNPFNLEASGDRLFFSAQGPNGRELYMHSGVVLTPFNLAPGTASSFPSSFTPVDTQAGLRTYFVANGELYISDGTFGGTKKMLNVATGVGQLTAVGDRLYFRAGNQLWVTGSNPEAATPFEEIIPPKVPLQVRVVAGEGDNQVTTDDLNARTVFTADTEIGAEAVSVDLTQAVRDALARGETRLTVRVENVSGDRDVILSLAGPARDGQTGLQVNPSSPGLVADLLAGDGTVIETGKAVIDLRAIESGRYYLRVYDPSGQANGDIPFKIEAIAPIQGYTHPVPDRDTIHGEDGDDLIVGSQGLDRLWGDSGRDDFIGELVELKDFDRPAGEQQAPSLPEERSTIPPEGPPVDGF
ncbi:MAG TPA: hypothetical protein VD737_07075, partial [Steroidobacteraceae bacterium]|nr:hypothetical protein [Steroidobacteraceae bacterium]